jgi:hypothetical protein
MGAKYNRVRSMPSLNRLSGHSKVPGARYMEKTPPKQNSPIALPSAVPGIRQKEPLFFKKPLPQSVT